MNTFHEDHFIFRGRQRLILGLTSSLQESGGVSLTFCQLCKIFSLNLCIADFVLRMRIRGWNVLRVPKAMLWTHVQSFSFKFSPYMWFLELYIFARLFSIARETLMKPHPDWMCSESDVCWLKYMGLKTRSCTQSNVNMSTCLCGKYHSGCIRRP